MVETLQGFMNFHYTNLETCHEAAGLVIVIDVIRAFTNAAFAFGQGAECILPVSGVEEALELRESGISAPILLLEGVVTPDELPLVDRHRLAMVVRTREHLAWVQAARPARPLALSPASRLAFGSYTIANRSPPYPQKYGATTPSARFAATIASTALPPSASIAAPAADAR